MMKSYLQSTIFLALFMFLLGCQIASPEEEKQTNKAIFIGAVQDETDQKPIENATVVLNEQTFKTNEEGKFQFEVECDEGYPETSCKKVVLSITHNDYEPLDYEFKIVTLENTESIYQLTKKSKS